MSGHTLKVKIGGAEFEASGTEESVQRQFEIFMRGLPAAGSNPQLPPPPLPDPNAGKKGQQEERPAGPVTELLKDAFESDDKLVWLKALPIDGSAEDRAADALLLILYGFRAVKGQSHVLVTQLAMAARKSGAGVDRIDRTILIRRDCYLKAGERRGGKYQLNAKGTHRAEALLRGMFA